jgi:hypothetical protein
VRAIPGERNNLWRDPEIVAVAIGLLLSVLFIDRWRSLEGKVDGLGRDQSSRLKDIQQFTADHIKLEVGRVVDKAEKLSAKLASISEQNPWLEVVTERDIIVETESVRGILRSAYNLLGENKTLHLFEYLDFCSRKGTTLDPRERQSPLRGTADDFLEIAIFCEIWLGDYALSVEFLRRYSEQAGLSAYIMYPDLIRRLVRIGDLPAARQHMGQLERIFRRRKFEKLLAFIDASQPMSGRYYWYACNVLALGHAALGRNHLVDRYLSEAKASPYAQRFAEEQSLIDAERFVHQHRFAEALALVGSEANGFDGGFSTALDRIAVWERLGEFERAAELRKRIDRARKTVHGDDWAMVEDAGREEHTTQRPNSPSAEGSARDAPERAAPVDPIGKEQSRSEARVETEHQSQDVHDPDKERREDRDPEDAGPEVGNSDNGRPAERILEDRSQEVEGPDGDMHEERVSDDKNQEVESPDDRSREVEDPEVKSREGEGQEDKNQEVEDPEVKSQEVEGHEEAKQEGFDVNSERQTDTRPEERDREDKHPDEKSRGLT